MAFKAASDAGQYPEAGPPFSPQKLYYSIFPHKMLKIAVRLMTFFGRDPHHFGKNRDIDLAEMVKDDFPVHAVIRLKKASVKIRDRAGECHASQLAGDPPGRSLFELISGLFGQRDCFMRAEPPVQGRIREHDLFDGVV
jgi:hypothetical protein